MFIWFWREIPQWARASSLTRFLVHTHGASQSVELLCTNDQLVAETFTWKHTTLTTYKTSMPPVGLEPAISAGERPQNYALDRPEIFPYNFVLQNLTTCIQFCLVLRGAILLHHFGLVRFSLFSYMGYCIRPSHPLPPSENQWYMYNWGTAVVQWLRCCVTNRKVAGSISAGVIEIFHRHKILPIALWLWSRLSF